MDVEGTLGTPWDYLQPKYDADGDGRITPNEYARSGGQFERLDRNYDGVISKDDYNSAGGRGRGRQMATMRATMAAFEHFQDDDDHQSLGLDEFKASIAAYDTNGDGAVQQIEFDETAPTRKIEAGSGMMKRMMGNSEPWPTLAGAIDSDGDDALASTELVSWFESVSGDDKSLTLPPMGRRQRRGGGPGARSSAGSRSGAMEDSIAPDFTLRPPDGGDPVTLSSFGDRNLPVALIFGSYT